MRRALEEPIRQIAENAGYEGSVIVEKVKAMVPLTRGFNAETNEYVDMMKAGIIDPTKVERVALQHAASIAALMLTTEAIVTDVPDGGSADHGGGMPPVVASSRVATSLSRLPPSPANSRRAASP